MRSWAAWHCGHTPSGVPMPIPVCGQKNTSCLGWEDSFWPIVLLILVAEKVPWKRYRRASGPKPATASQFSMVVKLFL